MTMVNENVETEMNEKGFEVKNLFGDEEARKEGMVVFGMEILERQDQEVANAVSTILTTFYQGMEKEEFLAAATELIRESIDSTIFSVGRQITEANEEEAEEPEDGEETEATPRATDRELVKKVFSEMRDKVVNGEKIIARTAFGYARDYGRERLPQIANHFVWFTQADAKSYDKDGMIKADKPLLISYSDEETRDTLVEVLRDFGFDPEMMDSGPMIRITTATR